MERITIEDFEKHGFSTQIAYKAVDDTEDDLIILRSSAVSLMVKLDPSGRYVIPYFEHQSDFDEIYMAIYAKDILNFSDLMSKLGKKMEDLAKAFHNKEVFARHISEELYRISGESIGNYGDPKREFKKFMEDKANG